MLRVAVNGSVLARGISGSARFVQLLAEALQTSDQVAVSVKQPPGRRRTTRLGRLGAWLAWDLVGFAGQAGADIYVAPTNVPPLRRRGRPVVTVVHDVMVLDLPELFDPGYRRVSQATFKLAAAWSDVIVTPSRFSRDRILQRLRPRCEVVVIPYAVEGCWFAGPKELPARQTVLAVGSTAPRKRLHLAVEAVDLARQLSGKPLRLVVVGPCDSDEERVRTAMALRDPDGRWTQRSTGLCQPRLRRLYRDAAVLLHPAVQEGFGYPVVEAAATGTPAVHGGGGSLAELLGGAIRATPPEPAAMAAELLRIIESEDVYRAESARVAEAAGDYALEVFGDRWLALLGRLIDRGLR